MNKIEAQQYKVTHGLRKIQKNLSKARYFFNYTFSLRLTVAIHLSLLFSCKNNNDIVVTRGSVSVQKVAYLALGDSYTIGTSVMPNERWSNLLASQLVNISNVDFIAQSGYVSGDLINAVKAANPRTDYGLVSLLIGVNNQFRRQDIEKYRIEFRELLNTATRLANGRADRVLVLTLPDWGLTPTGSFLDRKQISADIDSYNKVIVEECGLLKINAVNVTELSRLALNDLSLVSGDDLHYSVKMYKLWAEKIAPVAEGMLRK